MEEYDWNEGTRSAVNQQTPQGGGHWVLTLQLTIISGKFVDDSGIRPLEGADSPSSSTLTSSPLLVNRYESHIP